MPGAPVQRKPGLMSSTICCEIPVLAEFDCCHTHPMLTLPIGAEVELDATKQRVVLLAGA